LAIEQTRSGGNGPSLWTKSFKSLAFDQLHDDERAPVLCFVSVINAHGIRVLKLARQSSLLLETSHEEFVRPRVPDS